MYHSMSELLSRVEESSLCQGLPDDFDVMSVVVDPTSKVTTPGTVLRHSLPKILTSEQTQRETSVVLRSVDCEVIDDNLNNVNLVVLQTRQSRKQVEGSQKHQKPLQRTRHHSQHVGLQNYELR